jgi:hypothetical protein
VSARVLRPTNKETYPGLQISVCKSMMMHIVESLSSLKGNFSSLCLRQWRASVQIGLKIAVSKIFHRDEHGIVVFEPSSRFDETSLILRQSIVRTDHNVECEQTTYLWMRELCHSS